MAIPEPEIGAGEAAEPVSDEDEGDKAMDMMEMMEEMSDGVDEGVLTELGDLGVAEDGVVESVNIAKKPDVKTAAVGAFRFFVDSLRNAIEVGSQHDSSLILQAELSGITPALDGVEAGLNGDVAGVVVAAALFATRGALPKLKRIHSDETLNSGSNKFDLESQRTRSTDDIIDSLKPGSAEPLRVKPDGRIFDGNTRIKVLEERGVDIDSLPRTIFDE